MEKLLCKPDFGTFWRTDIYWQNTKKSFEPCLCMLIFGQKYCYSWILLLWMKTSTLGLNLKNPQKRYEKCSKILIFFRKLIKIKLTNKNYISCSEWKLNFCIHIGAQRKKGSKKAKKTQIRQKKKDSKKSQKSWK